jgi:hypothetical protein
MASASTAPKLLTAASRMRHGLSGAYDIALPLGDPKTSGVECRNVANGMMLVLKFDQPVVAGSAKVTGGTE